DDAQKPAAGDGAAAAQAAATRGSLSGGGLEPDDRILNRLLTTYWRQAHGGLPGPRERRYWEAVDWVNQFHAYIRRLSDYFRYEAEEPERLGKLPLAIALPLPAAELI